MTILANGRSYTPLELLIYWIQERYRIRTVKERGDDKPWSTDPVFQETYFCNVHREDDKVTRFIRKMYSDHVRHDLFEYNIVFARFINRPSTLSVVGYMHEHSPRQLADVLRYISSQGAKVWGNAYVITTHGQKMDKVDYLCDQVLPAVKDLGLSSMLARATPTPTCSNTSRVLKNVDGIGSFLAGQVVADLKNTPGHSLASSADRSTFVEPGPGSIRGIDWICWDTNQRTTPANFHGRFSMIREWLNEKWPEGVPPVDNQDLQNCLCEFDKYCRVVTASGRSKRKYNGR